MGKGRKTRRALERGGSGPAQRLNETLARWPGVRITPMFGRWGYFVGDTLFGCFPLREKERDLWIRLSESDQARALSDPRIRPHRRFSKKGWICKTWEGEMAMVSMPGSATEKFLFTVWNDGVADEINKVMGRRVALHYEQKVGLPTSCFGDTRYFVTGVTLVEEIPLAPGVIVPTPAPPAPSR